MFGFASNWSFFIGDCCTLQLDNSSFLFTLQLNVSVTSKKIQLKEMDLKLERCAFIEFSPKSLTTLAQVKPNENGKYKLETRKERENGILIRREFVWHKVRNRKFQWKWFSRSELSERGLQQTRWQKFFGKFKTLNCNQTYKKRTHSVLLCAILQASLVIPNTLLKCTLLAQHTHVVRMLDRSFLVIFFSNFPTFFRLCLAFDSVFWLCRTSNFLATLF